jgi:hypothetical protein
MNELQAGLLAEYISLAYDELGAQPLTQEQEQLLIDRCVQQVQVASYPPAEQEGNRNEH